MNPDELAEIGTNALIDALWRRGDLGLAAATLEKRRADIQIACDDLRRLGCPEDALAPILLLVDVPYIESDLTPA